MASKANPTPPKPKPKPARGRGTGKRNSPPEAKAGNTVGAKGTPSAGHQAEGAGSAKQGLRQTSGHKKHAAEDHSHQDAGHKSNISDHKVENFGSALSTTAPKDTASLSSAQRLKVGSSKPDITNPKTAVASPKVVKAKPKPKGSVSSPKHDSGTAKARAAGAKPKASKVGGGTDSEHDEPGTRTHSPRRSQATPGKLSPKTYSARVSHASANKKSGATSPKSGSGTARKSGVTSPKKAGVTGTKRGGVTSPRKGGVTSPRKGDGVSPKTAAKKASASRVSSPRKAGSQPSSQKRTKVKTKIAEDASAVDESKNKEARAAFKRQRGRRKSVVAAAVAKLRKSLKPEQEGGSKSSGETTLSSKDQMSLFLVATVAGFLLVFMATLIFVFFVGGTNIPEGVSCITDECLEAKEYLDSLLNDTRDPCTDFYGYVCGTWQEKGGSFHGEATLSALFRLNTTLLHMRSVKRKEEIRQGMHILRPIYSGCYSYMSKPAKLKDALNDAQKFLDISQLMNAASFFDVVRYLVRQSLQVGVYTLFHIRFIYEAGRPMLFMTEGYTLAQKLGQPFDTGDAQQSFARVLKIWLNLSNVDSELALLSDMDAEVAKIFQTGSKAEEQLSLRDAVANMVPGVSAEDWVAAVSASQRQGIVLVPTDDIITHGSKIYKPATQTVVKRGLRNATFYLATILEADVLYVLSTHMKISKSDVHKGLYCLAFTHKCLALTWAYLAARLLAPVGSTGVIFNILKFMKEIVQETDEVLSWMKNTTAVKAKELLSKTSLDVIAGEGFNISRVDYTGPEPQLDESDPFLKNLVGALRHHHTVMAANPPTRLEVLLSDLEFSSTFTYVPERKSILVPTLYQNNPYLYPFRVPDFFNYGTMAVLLANILIAEVVGTSFGNPLQGTWDDETRLNYTEVASCLGDRRASLGFGELSRVSGGKQKALILSLTMSVRLAYYALMKTFRIQAGTAKVFNDYWPAAEEVFFARFCLLWCSASNDANPLTPREKCMLPLYNMEEFVDHYGCKSHANFSTAAFCKV